jgi:hypothetical protein
MRREPCPDGGGYFAFIECKSCRARSGDTYYSTGNDCAQTYTGRREEWNTRASDARIADLERQIAEARAVSVPEAARFLFGDVFPLVQAAVDDGWHRAEIVDGFPYEETRLDLPLNDPCTGDKITVGSLSIEDSGVAPSLWRIAIAVLRALSEETQP